MKKRKAILKRSERRRREHELKRQAQRRWKIARHGTSGGADEEIPFEESPPAPAITYRKALAKLLGRK